MDTLETEEGYLVRIPAAKEAEAQAFSLWEAAKIEFAAAKENRRESGYRLIRNLQISVQQLEEEYHNCVITRQSLEFAYRGLVSFRGK